MLIVMEHSATEPDIQRVIETLVAAGYDIHRSTGVSHTVLGAVGVARERLEPERLALLPGVKQVVPITDP